MRIRLSVCLIAMLYAAADVDDTIVAEDLELSAIEETVASQGREAAGSLIREPLNSLHFIELLYFSHLGLVQHTV